MTDHRAVLSAAFDGECADPAALEDALRHPDAVSTLVEFARLRARLRSDLSAHFASAPAGDAEAIENSREHAEKLKSLGYL